jgi:hypothetical protein
MVSPMIGFALEGAHSVDDIVRAVRKQTKDGEDQGEFAPASLCF